jgi:putative nucleotidyltransferase with HDIG domain
MSDIKEELENLVDNLSQQLAEGYFQVVKMLTIITETTEKYYEGSHSRFVSDKSALIAEQLGMSDEDVIEVKVAGLLHDIGKLGFPEPLMYKFPSEMSQQEYINYTKHCDLGYNILKQYKNFETIAEMVYQHHEKIDGSGFPHHLQKDQILAGAKIIVVAEYFHNQMYKTKRIKSEQNSNQFTSTSSFLESTKERYAATMNFLNRKKGIIFERKVVDIFIEIMESERKMLGSRSVMRLSVNGIEPGMIFAEDYYTSYGMLIAAKGETITRDTFSALQRFIQNDEMPAKILVIK